MLKSIRNATLFVLAAAMFAAFILLAMVPGDAASTTAAEPKPAVPTCQTVSAKRFNSALKTRRQLGGKAPRKYAHKPVCIRPHYRKVQAQIKRLRRCNGGTPAKNRCLGQRMAAERGWVGQQWQCLDELWGGRESGWDHRVVNGHRPWSQRFQYASGIPQFMPIKGRPVPPNWHIPRVQIEWGLNYIAGRYGNPCAALAYHNGHNSY